MKILSKMISFNLIKDGENGEPGKPGPSLVYAGAWREDVTYLKDDVINHYVHQVRNGNKEFYLLQTPQSLGEDPYINNTQGNGDIWRRVEQHDLILARKIQADEIETSQLIAKFLKTSNVGPRVEISGSTIDVYGVSGVPNIKFGVDESGFAVLTYYDNEGTKLYDLGPGGLKNIEYAPSSYTPLKLYYLAGNIPQDELTFNDVQKVTWDSIIEDSADTFYKYYAGGKPDISSSEREKEKYVYTNKSTSGSKISDGWYFFPPQNIEFGRYQYMSRETGMTIRPGGDNALYEYSYGVLDKSPIYLVEVYYYKDGMFQISKQVFWNGLLSSGPSGGVLRD